MVAVLPIRQISKTIDPGREVGVWEYAAWCPEVAGGILAIVRRAQTAGVSVVELCRACAPGVEREVTVIVDEIGESRVGVGQVVGERRACYLER